MGLDPVSLAAQAIPSVISTITGIFQRHRANKLEKQNVRPLYSVPQEIKANQAQAQQMATQGLPQEQYLKQQQAIARNATSAISNAQTRRGGLGLVGAIDQNSNDANMTLNAADAAARMNNIRNLLQQNNIMAQYKDKMWGWNQQSKFQEQAAAIRALRGAGYANINSGLNGLIGAGATAGEQMGGFGQNKTKAVNFHTVGDDIDRNYSSPSSIMEYLNRRQQVPGGMVIGE